MGQSRAKVTQPMSLNDLRLGYTETIHDLEDDTITPQKANALAHLRGGMMASYKLEMEYHRMLGTPPNIPALLTGSQE